MFERYTEQARRAVFFARYETIVRGRKAIGTGDLLSGLTWEEGTRANSIGALKENAVLLKQILKIPHFPCTAIRYCKNVEIPLERDGKIALAYAAEEANSDGEYWVDTDHLARAFLRFENEAGAALLQIGKNLDDWRVGSRNSRQENPTRARPQWSFVTIAWTKWGWLLRATRGIWILLLFLALLVLTLKLRSPD